MFQGQSDGVTGGKFQATAKATTRSSPLLSLSLRSATGDRAPPPFFIKGGTCPRTNMVRPFGSKRRLASFKNQGFLDAIFARGTLFRVSA